MAILKGIVATPRSCSIIPVISLIKKNPGCELEHRRQVDENLFHFFFFISYFSFLPPSFWLCPRLCYTDVISHCSSTFSFSNSNAVTVSVNLNFYYFFGSLKCDALCVDPFCIGMPHEIVDGTWYLYRNRNLLVLDSHSTRIVLHDED